MTIVSMALPELPTDILKMISSRLARVEGFHASFKRASALRWDGHALALWLQHNYPVEGALAALPLCPAVAQMESKEVRVACQTLLHALPLLQTPKQLPAASYRALLLMGLSKDDEQLIQMVAAVASEDRSTVLADVLTSVSASGRDKFVRALLSAGARPKGCETLKAAAEHGHASVVCTLLDAGVDPRADSDCALRTAAKHGHVACLALLLRAGCCPRAKQCEALCLSVGAGHAEAVRLLLQCGADASARPGLLQLALSAPGEQHPEEELVAMLLGAGACDENGAALCNASTSGREQVVALLLTHGASPHLGARTNLTPEVLSAALQNALINGEWPISTHAGYKSYSTGAFLKFTLPLGTGTKGSRV